jgi:TorA maturation chaperone TorD
MLEELDAGLPPSPADEHWHDALNLKSTDLEREYVRLFLDPMGAACPPWQSCQGNAPQLLGEPHHKALAWFRRSGVEPVHESEPADHIGLLLSFYGRLLSEDISPAERALFRRDHLAWIPGYCAKLEAETRLEFYRLAARLAAELVEDAEIGE